MNPAFILMKLRDLDDSESRLGSVRLCDILPGMPSAGFSTLVAYMEQLREIHGLRVSVVRFRGAHNDDISISDLNIVAYGRKSLVMLRRSRSTVLKICLPADAGTEREIHSASDYHPNLRQLLNWGTVDVGNREGVFQFLELDGFGEPFRAKHVSDLASTEMMWNQAFEGLRHLHRKSILHRDVKPDNMLVFKGNVLKINDYDISCFKTDRQELRRKVGTRGYHSPSSSMQPYKEEDDILSLALAFYSAKLGIKKSSRTGRLQILRCCLDPHLFPACMRMAVEDALRKLGLDQEQNDEDNEDEENEDEDEDDDEEG
ncbi:spindle assembly checkpoint kinase [Selaginella moellendorffii]|uniref:spindle assembly checkpoint kinase n=1 Tax=Selaginella moellendorffii TaxID=88036 RepID=UPI000D1D0730|nr:spindle assembly checkpoint kinase [Selaginella moellendorffii]|eukprot:XP_024520586.1 spindle assembly checkpoint kinase [Selaginella moellendorffii]